MKIYMYKDYFLKYISDCPKSLKISSNDFESYEMFPKYKKLYNKKYIAESQHLLCGDQINDENIDFPVIVRPVTNLYGMGLGAYYLYEKKQIKKTDFWCEILKGLHISVDIFYNSFGINGYIAFYGKSDELFTFSYWEYLPNYKLPNNIINWIHNNLRDYNGVFNIEIIGDKIIECHLRMGDINYFQDKNLIDKLIKCHQNQKIVLHKLPKIYLVPVFVDKDKKILLRDEDIWYFCRITNTIKYVKNYLIDPLPSNDIGNPLGGNRICMFTVTDLEKGMKIKREILNNLDRIDMS